LARFLEERTNGLVELVPTDVFDWVDWQVKPRSSGRQVVPITAGRGAAPASVNRRAAAARAFFEYLVLAGVRADNPVPSPRRGQGLRPKARGVLGHLAILGSLDLINDLGSSRGFPEPCGGDVSGDVAVDGA
jgi:hypothetical protein